MCLWNTKIQIKSTERAQFLIDHFSEPVIIIIILFSGTSWSSFRCLRETPVLIPDAPRNSFTVHRRCVQLQVSPIWQKHHGWLLLLLLVSRDMTSVERTFSCQTVMRLKALSPLTFRWSVVSTKKACCLSDSLSRASGLSGQKDSRILSRSSERLFFRSGVTLHLWKISRWNKLLNNFI